MKVTVAAMATQGHRRADHASYIAAVRRGLEARDIGVADVTVTTSGDGRREATLLLRPDEDAFVERVPGEASARWDEDNGWLTLVRRESLATCGYKGLAVVPDPEDVAARVVVLLTHPELTASREEHSFRDHCVPDPDFEALLAMYAAAG